MPRLQVNSGSAKLTTNTMKERLRKLMNPLLSRFENNSDDYQLTPTNRKVALFISGTFLILAIVIPFIVWPQPITSFIFPVIVFGSLGIVGLIVGTLGTDHAVAKLVGNRRK